MGNVWQVWQTVAYAFTSSLNKLGAPAPSVGAIFFVVGSGTPDDVTTCLQGCGAYAPGAALVGGTT
jgi:hypothetical protein